jgi:hypothetical protein
MNALFERSDRRFRFISYLMFKLLVYARYFSYAREDF